MPFGAYRINSIAKGPVSATGVSLDAVAFDSGEYYYLASPGSGTTASKKVTGSVWTNIKQTSPRSAATGFTASFGRLIVFPWQYNNGSTQADATFRIYVQTRFSTFNYTASETDLYTTNEWNHFVFSIDLGVANSIRGYVNGNAVTWPTQTTSTSDIFWDSIASIEINGYNNGSFASELDLAQYYLTDYYYDLDDPDVLAKFYDNGPVDMGSDGTASGLVAPLIYHNGNTSSIATNSGTISYTLNAVGTPADTTGPTT